MNAEGLKSKLEITGRKEAMVPYGIRLPRTDARVLARAAKANRCRSSDLLRTAWQEYIITHKLTEEIA